MLCSIFFSYVLLSNSFIETLEEQILFGLLQFFRVSSFYLDGNLFVGSFYSSSQYFPPVHTQVLFLIFFPSLALATRSTFEIRMRILLFGGLCFIAFITIQFLIILTMLALGVTSDVGLVQASIIFTGVTAALVIEALLFTTITLPKQTKVQVAIKRSYIDEYVYLALLLLISSLLIYFIFTILQIKTDSPIASYVALNVSTILSFKYYLSYFLWEARAPIWAKWIRTQQKIQYSNNMAVSFLLPAYNEEKHIKKCVESIDRAAANYSGNTEIIIVNDGSTDNTGKISEEAIHNIKHCTGKVFHLPNSGKGIALQYGLERLTGDIVFRIDSDSIVDEYAITPILNHFKDPQVGSVSGMIFPMEEKSLWQKAMILLGCLFVFYRRGQELIDSILVQPGAFSVFRKEALIKVGGWARDQFGEDGELTIRLGRYGYKNEFEQHAIILSEAPRNLKELREQRIRWGIAYYHSRARNLQIIKEFNGPRSIMYILNLLSHGGGFAQALFWPFLIAAVLTDERYSIYNFVTLLGIPLQLIVIELVVFGLQYILYIYFLFRFKKLYCIKYIPLMRLYVLVLTVFFKPEAMEILLFWSSKWKQHTKESNDALKKIIKKPI